jgi:hypothetical protein
MIVIYFSHLYLKKVFISIIILITILTKKIFYLTLFDKKKITGKFWYNEKYCSLITLKLIMLI